MVRYSYVACVVLLLAASAAGQGQAPVAVQSRAIIVTGNVQRPGVYPVDPSHPPGLLRLLSQSGGPIEWTGQFGTIYRADDRGVTREISIDIKEVVSGRQPDVPLQAGDVLYIPRAQPADRRVPDGKSRAPIRDLLPPVAERR